MITIDDFKKIDVRMGKILSAERVPETDKLIKLSVDLGEEEPRQIVSGIAEYFENIEDLVGRTTPFVVNLEPRTIRGFESNGMLFAVSTNGGDFAMLLPDRDIAPGSGTR